MTSEVTSDHGQHPHSGAQPGAHSVRSVFHVIISRKYKMLCRSHARERERARMCCIRTDCVILDLSSSGAGCTYRGCPGIFSFIATRTIFRVLGLIHITIVFIRHDCIFPSTSNEMQEALSICGSRDSLPLCLIEI